MADVRIGIDLKRVCSIEQRRKIWRSFRCFSANIAFIRSGKCLELDIFLASDKSSFH